ncbi:MAG: DUF3883 domain-containing protein, partial [Zetaproteobacteria bacterium]
NLARAIGHRLRAQGLEDALENLLHRLAQGREEAKRFLQRKGIDAHLVARWLDAPPAESALPALRDEGGPTEAPYRDGLNAGNPDSGRQDGAHTEADDATGVGTRTAVGDDGGRQRAPTGGLEGLGPGEQAVASGDQAEALVFKELCTLFGCDRVRDVSTEHEQGRECDLLVLDERGEVQALVEVKSLGQLPGRAYWSQSEADTALRHRDKYLVAFVHDGEIRWARKGLDQLRPRQGFWIWSAREKRVPVDLDAHDPWRAPCDPPARKPDRFCFEVVVDESTWGELDSQFPLTDRLS